MLCDNGRATGVGDIHNALYQAYADTKALTPTSSAKAYRDVTAGSNGAAADAGTDPSVNAAIGYDTVSGLGGVLWSALTPYLLGGAAPTASCPGPAAGTATPGTIANTAHLAVRMVGHGRHRHAVVTATWSTTAAGSTVAGATVRLTRGNHTTYTGTRPTGEKQVRARTGRTYTLTVTSTDSQGHTVTTTQHLKVRPRHHHLAHRPGGPFR